MIERLPAVWDASARLTVLLLLPMPLLPTSAAAEPDCVAGGGGGGGTLPALFVDVCDMAPGLKGPLPGDDAEDEDEPPEGLNEFSCDPPDSGEGALCDIIDDDDVWPTLPLPSNCNENKQTHIH